MEQIKDEPGQFFDLLLFKQVPELQLKCTPCQEQIFATMDGESATFGNVRLFLFEWQ